MHIRAGILCQLIDGQLNKDHLLEIIYWSGWTDQLKAVYNIYKILELYKLDPTLYYKPIADYNLSNYFGQHTNLATKYLELVPPEIICYYFHEVYFIDIPYITIGNPAKGWNKQTLGHIQENKAVEIFNQIYGYEIASIGRQSYKIPGTNITISGRPDGYIKSSPGGIFDDFILEIKYSRNKRQDDYQIRKNKVQMASYCKTFNKSVMLIVYSKNTYNVFRYLKNMLNKFWDKEILPKLHTQYPKLFERLCISSPEDIPKYLSSVSKT